MYKLLIAEDEAILREGVSEELSAMDLFDIDVASNGKEAFEMALLNQYDAILLDIRMPQMDGLELLKKLQEVENDSIKLIMSGYAEFDYAQKGIKYGVADYIVKPLTPDKIRQIGERVYKMIEQKKDEDYQVEQLKVKVEDSRPVWGDMILSRMVNGEYGGEEAEERLSAKGIVFPSESIRLLLLHPVDEQERPKTDCPMFRISTNTLAIVSDKTEEEVMRFAEYYAEKHPEGVICAVSGEQAGSERLKDAYADAEEALRYAQLLEKNGIVRYSDVKSSGSNIFLDELEFRMQLALAKKEALQEWLDQLFEDIPLNASRQDYYSLAIYIAMLCQNNVRKLSAERAHMTIDYEAVLHMRTRKEIKAWVAGLLNIACKQVFDNSRQRGLLEVEKTKSYIDEHLSEDISMADLAKHAYLSPNYLGKVFLEKVGMSISEYINMRRIERACELIRQGNAKIYEIAEMVGIRDPNYFSALFKKIQGISPSEYKSLIGSQEKDRKA